QKEAIDCLRVGAVDLIEKPVRNWENVGRSLRRALAERDLKVERARLMAELMQRNEDLNKAVTLLRKTIDISETMHASKSVDDVLDLLLGTATDVFGAQRVSIMIRDPKNDEMAIQLAQGMNRAMVKHVRI